MSVVAFAGSAVDLETRRQMAVMLGSGGGAVEFSERMYELWYKGALKQASVYSVPSGTIGTIASEISMAYDLHGYSHLISTGCTSSTDAIGYAYRNLKLGVCDYVITGGAGLNGARIESPNSDAAIAARPGLGLRSAVVRLGAMAQDEKAAAVRRLVPLVAEALGQLVVGMAGVLSAHHRIEAHPRVVVQTFEVLVHLYDPVHGNPRQYRG